MGLSVGTLHLLRPLPTSPLRLLHRPGNPLHRLRLLRLLLRPAAAAAAAAARLNPPLRVGRRPLRRQEAQTTPKPIRRLRSRTLLKPGRPCSIWGRWFASLVDLVRERWCIPPPSTRLGTDQKDPGLLQSNSHVTRFSTFITRLIVDFSGSREVDFFGSINYLCRNPRGEVLAHRDMLHFLWCSQGVIPG